MLLFGWRHPVVAEVDVLQHDVGEGPYLDAVTLGLTFYADELGEESRWPRWYSLICPLTDSDTPGSIEGDKSLQVRGEPVAV